MINVTQITAEIVGVRGRGVPDERGEGGGGAGTGEGDSARCQLGDTHTPALLADASTCLATRIRASPTCSWSLVR